MATESEGRSCEWLPFMSISHHNDIDPFWGQFWMLSLNHFQIDWNLFCLQSFVMMRTIVANCVNILGISVSLLIFLLKHIISAGLLNKRDTNEWMKKNRPRSKCRNKKKIRLKLAKFSRHNIKFHVFYRHPLNVP